MTETDTDTNDPIIREAMRIEEDCNYSSKGHYNAAASWAGIHLKIGLPTAILAAIGSGTAFKDWGVIAGAIGILTTALIAVTTFLDPSQQKNAHRSAGDQFLALKNATRRFRNIELATLGPEDARNWLDELSKRRDNLNAASPQIPRKAFDLARKGIEEGEATHAIDKPE